MHTATRGKNPAATLLRLVAAACVCAGLVPQRAVGQTGVDTTGLDSLRHALLKYRDVVLAIHDGYFSTLGCVEIPHAGAPGHVPYRPGNMGVHFLNVQTISPTPRPDQPQVLLYEPAGDSLRLVGAEWFVPLATGVTERPRLMNQPFDGPMEGHHPLMPREMTHYDLHVWLYKPNPYGVFSATNPNVRCGRYRYTMREEAPPLVSVPAR